MKLLTSLYRRALDKDFKGTNDQANAVNLKQVLYENKEIFGNLYKPEIFRNVFGSRPVLTEFVTFVSFWKGVESVLDGEYRTITVPMRDVLYKSCYVDDEYVSSLRFFRDEILKNDLSLTRSELLESINKTQKNSKLYDFWSKVFDNTKQMFTNENVSIFDISNMVLGFLIKKYAEDVYLESETEPLTASLTGNEKLNLEDKLVSTESPLQYEDQVLDSKVEFNLDDADNSWSYEYKYRKLLLDLETSLPKFYTYYSDAKSEIKELREEMKRLMEDKDNLDIKFSEERTNLMETNTELQNKLNSMIEKNEDLNKELVSKESKIEDLTRRVDEATELFASSDYNKVFQEMQVYMGKCDGFQKTNQNLKSKISELEMLLESVNQQVKEDMDNESIQNLITERDSLLEILELTETERVRLLDETKQLTLSNESLTDELAGSRLQMTKYFETENKLNDEKLQLEKELETLKRENQVLELEVLRMREENEFLSEKMKQLSDEVDSLSKDNKLLKEKADNLNVYMDKIAQMEQELKEVNAQKGYLKRVYEEVSQENFKLVSKLEILNNPTPTDAKNKLMDIIGKYHDIQSPLSNESESTDCDPSCNYDTPSTTRIKIHRDLAEVREINTRNALKYGLLRADSSLTPDNTMIYESDRMIHRQTSNLQRSLSVDDDTPSNNYYENLSISNYNDLGIADEEKPDIIKNAITFFSKKLNLN